LPAPLPSLSQGRAQQNSSAFLLGETSSFKNGTAGRRCAVGNSVNPAKLRRHFAPDQDLHGVIIQRWAMLIKAQSSAE
jgi:hypothetical protein